MDAINTNTVNDPLKAGASTDRSAAEIAAAAAPLFQIGESSDDDKIDLDELFNDIYYLNLPGGLQTPIPDPTPVVSSNTPAGAADVSNNNNNNNNAPETSMSSNGSGAANSITNEEKKRSASSAGFDHDDYGDLLDDDKNIDPKNLTEQQKIERRERNREHAKRSRLRKKFLLESLQGQIQELEEQIKGLKQAIVDEVPTEKAHAIIQRICGDKEKYTPLPMPSGFGPVKTLMEPDFRLMSALSGSQQNFAISDPTLPDNPIVYVSQGFLDLTGYTLDQVLGRNCRFLQGPGTDQSAVQVIRKGISEGVDTSVCLLNYRADGTPFWNQFFVAALRDAEGNVVNYVGVQCEVSKAVVEKNMPQPKKKIS
ncbi:hypothetical protein ACA910_021368 [Epithemia clementina (nom. ined.)]